MYRNIKLDMGLLLLLIGMKKSVFQIALATNSKPVPFKICEIQRHCSELENSSQKRSLTRFCYPKNVSKFSFHLFHRRLLRDNDSLLFPTKPAKHLCKM